MQISLPEHQETFVSQQAKTAGYHSPDEWVQDLLQGAIFDRMLELDPQFKAQIDESLERGLADIEAGRTIPMDEAMERIKNKLRAKHNNQ